MISRSSAAIGTATILLSLVAAVTASAQSLTLTGTVRDFLYTGTAAGTYNGFAGVGHPDFNQGIGVDDPGIVTTTLGVDGKPIYANPGGTTLTTNGEVPFNQWFNDTPGVNVSTTIDLHPTFNSGTGNFVFQDNDFFPIDGKLFGDQSNGHNFAFTLEISTVFTYLTGQTFSFTGDDDVWVYIDGERVIDLGGVHPPETDSVDLDTLGLTPGMDYRFNIFFAERQTPGTSFGFTTNILFAVPEASTLSLALPGLLLLGGTIALRRRSRT